MLKQLFIKYLIIVAIFVFLILITSAIFPNLDGIAGRMVSGASLVISWAIGTWITKKMNRK
ncbi:hypothetical protein [Aquibacillus saliphilus]|uniref:hypothetical protein n=1 Tax=Aquibacillus saliphilus TaxID=1909422 RepID=UPI001CF0A7CE|nr:hypothetical protein [Aquibacillus saliphilus]